MKIKTSELNGVVLDWAVAKAEREVGLIRNNPQRFVVITEEGSVKKYAPSIDWAQGGCIIERHRIATMYWTGRREWAAKPDSKKGNEPNHFGPSLLIAAMRCFVAVELGDLVEIPDELIK